jgi:hypothetical protein
MTLSVQFDINNVGCKQRAQRRALVVMQALDSGRLEVGWYAHAGRNQKNNRAYLGRGTERAGGFKYLADQGIFCKTWRPQPVQPFEMPYRSEIT